MATTRKDLRQRIGRTGFCGDMLTSTATGSGVTATMTDTKLPNSDDTFNGGQLVITSGAGAVAGNDRRWITDYVGSSGVITPDRAFAGAVANGDAYELHRTFSADEKDEAINAAILEVKLRWARIIEDATLTFTVNTYTYALAGLAIAVDPIALIDKIEYDTGASGTGYPYAALDDDLWSVRNNAGVLTLQFNERASAIIPNGKAIRLTYRARPATMSTDTDATTGTLKPDEEGFFEYLAAKATALLAEKRANLAHEAGDTKSHWEAMAQKFHARAESVFGQDKPLPEPGRVIVAPSYRRRGYIDRDVTRIHID